MSAVELYTKDTRVWIPDIERVWRSGTLLENFNLKLNKLKILTEEEEIIEYDLADAIKSLPPLRNPDILIGQNDLTSLSYLNEPEVLYNLEVRFLNNSQIYTYCGIVLVAINPYEQLPIYGNEIIQAYNGRDVQNLDPHIFAVSEQAFQKLIQFEQNQSIIVSGESGAGKTVSAKYTMRYFANVGGSTEETQIEKKVLASNPIMEAFGNAKTTRNDNSSRFGKYIQIDFNKQHHIVGASMKTYLLEKSRVVFQAENERNYHIFYQLSSQRANKRYAHLKLGPTEHYYYTCQGDAAQIDKVNDSDVFKETIEAFNLIGITEAEQSSIFSIIASIMHLGNIKLVEVANDSSCAVKQNDEFLANMCRLLEVNEDSLRTWLCNKRIKTANEVVNTQLSLSQAYFARDALAKHMYSQVFNWIVSQINKCLKSTNKTQAFIGVLDIYGFETFQINSFEQFCINYANEKLQQQFCQHVFKLEQEEYMREQIKWSFIEFYDNQPCIDLIEGKLGILDLLDEECKVPKGSDVTWCSKLYDKHLKTSKHFSKPRMSQSAFIIHHFAENVQYTVDGFLEKNRDTVLEDQLKVLKSSESEFIAELFMEDTDESKTKGYEVKKHHTLQAPIKTQINRKKTVGSQFRESLQNLMNALNSTTPHYVRCIKPNDQKAPFRFDGKRAVEQLRACGVLETVRISAAGYPSRWTYLEFFHRYRMLASSKLINRQKIRETCEAILISLIKERTKYQFGKTKIFFQAGQVAYLEKLRSEKLKSSGIMIQKHIRGWLAKCKYLKIRKSAALIQRYGKGVLARRLLMRKRETRAAIVIQSQWRGFMCRKQYARSLQTIIKLQAICRGYIARKNRALIKQNIKATKIQACVRGWLQRKRYRKIVRGIVLIQAHFRRRKARKFFKIMKIESKSVEHQRKLNKGLENKIISLQQQIEKNNKEKEFLVQRVHEIEPLKVQINSLKINANSVKENLLKVSELNDLLSHVKADLAKVNKEKESLTRERDELKRKTNETLKSNDSQIVELTKKLEEANEKNKALQAKIDGLNAKLADVELERANHQKLIKEHNKLEQRFDKARNELLKYRNLQQASAESINIDTAQIESLLEDLDYDKSDNNVPTRQTTSAPELLNHAREDTQQHQQHGNQKQQDEFEQDYELIKAQELEIENNKLRDELNQLRKLYDADSDQDEINAEIKRQFFALNDELQRRRDECIQYKTIMVNQNRLLNRNSKNQTYTKDDLNSLVSDSTNEFELAFNTQKILNRMLEDQLQDAKKAYEDEKLKLLKENKTLKESNEKQHEILMQNLPPESLAEQTYKLEVDKLCDENLELRERHDHMIEEVKKYKKALKLYINRSKTMNVNEANAYMNTTYDTSTMASMSTATITNSTTLDTLLPQIKYKHGEYMGILEWKTEDEAKIINRLIYDLKPRLAITFLPGTPAYTLFMCIRYADMLNDDERVRLLLNNTVHAIKKIIKKKQEDLEYAILWLANLCRLLHNLKQYSGEEAFQLHNTQKQNDHCLKNFDLTEYRGILSDIAIWLYQGVIREFQKKISAIIVPAMLENESLSPGGMFANTTKPSGSTRSLAFNDSEKNSEKISVNELSKKLTEFLNLLNSHGIDPEIVNQIIKQLFFYIGSSTFNNLVLRKGLCHWAKGLEIRYNLSHLEQWLRDSKLQDSGAADILEPIIQATQLLQARKTEKDIKTICEMCSKLTIAQIQRILLLYTPLDEYEEKLSRSFVDKVTAQLRDLRATELEEAQQTVIIDTQIIIPISIPFNPSSIGLETIEIPEQLNLQFLKRI